MTKEEREAREWLEWYGGAGGYTARHARTLQSLLDHPRLPEEPTDEILTLMREAPLKSGDADDDLNPEWGKSINRAKYRALYKHLTTPPIKWRVSWSGANTNGGCTFSTWSEVAGYLHTMGEPTNYTYTIAPVATQKPLKWRVSWTGKDGHGESPDLPTYQAALDWAAGSPAPETRTISIAAFVKEGA